MKTLFMNRWKIQEFDDFSIIWFSFGYCRSHDKTQHYVELCILNFDFSLIWGDD